MFKFCQTTKFLPSSPRINYKTDLPQLVPDLTWLKVWDLYASPFNLLLKKEKNKNYNDLHGLTNTECALILHHTIQGFNDELGGGGGLLKNKTKKKKKKRK